MKKPHHYYKFAAMSTVGGQLQGFMNRCKDAEETARQWAEKQGASQYYESVDGMAGGVSAVEFADTTAKDGWDKVVTSDGRVFYLPMEDTDLEKEMYGLPVVSEAELITILNLIPQKTAKGLPLPFTFGDTTPVVFQHHGYWYVDVPYVSADISAQHIEEKVFNRRKMAATNERS